jgi:anti-sigma factor RsiW
MMAKISNKDWERLSAYLDGELNQKEIEQIELRIKADPVFQAALEEIRSARQILRATPRVSVPRDFRLTPALIGAKPRSRSFQIYRLAAATLSFLFIGVVVLDFGRSFSGAAFAPAAPREVMLEAVPEAAMDAVEEPALMAEEEQEMADRAAEESPPAEAEGATQPAPEVAAEAGDEAVGLAEEGETKSADEPGADLAANQAEEPEEELAAEQQLTPSVPPVTTQTQEPTHTPDPVEDSEATYWQEPQPDPGIVRIDLIRILEVLFGLGAVVLGIMAWRKRRRG